MFFSDEVGIVLQEFGFLHILLFFIIIFGSIAIFVFREKIRNVKFERKIAIGIASFALFWELALYTWKIGNGIWTWDDGLPIGLCGFTLYIGIFSLMFKKFQLFEIGYFWTWGAIASILFPDILFSFDRFRFYQFMFGHMLFFLMYVYMIAVYKWYPTWKSWRKSCITLSIIVVILVITSNITDKNLMFMLESEGTPFEIFEGGAYILYLLGVVSMSFAIIYLWFVPFLFLQRKKANKKSI